MNVNIYLCIHIYIYTHNRYIMFCSRSELSIVIYPDWNIQTSQLDFSGFGHALPCAVLPPTGQKPVGGFFQVFRCFHSFPTPSFTAIFLNTAHEAPGAQFHEIFCPTGGENFFPKRYHIIRIQPKQGNNIIQLSTFERTILTSTT